MSANRRRVFVIGVGMTKVRSHLGKGLGMMLRGEVIPPSKGFWGRKLWTSAPKWAAKFIWSLVGILDSCGGVI